MASKGVRKKAAWSKQAAGTVRAAPGKRKVQAATPLGRSGERRKVVTQRRGCVFSDGDVAAAVAQCLPLDATVVRETMRRWSKAILKVPIPGKAAAIVAQRDLLLAQRRVLRFLRKEEALGGSSHVAQAFRLVTQEPELHFDWNEARERVRHAKLHHRRPGLFKHCLAMNTGHSVATMSIHINAARPMTQKALTSLLCHESLHNLARRTRRGNPFLAEDTEHIVMALLGDPQLSS